MTTKKTTTKKVGYSVRVKIFGKTYSGKGSTFAEAMTSVKPGNVKGTSVITVTKGKVSREKVLPAAQTFRLFNASGMMREIALKNLSIIFGM